MAATFDPAQPPPPLLTNRGFAHKTMSQRQPAVIDKLLEAHAYPPPLVDDLRTLQAELREDQTVRPLHTAAPDGPAWQALWAEQQGRTWLNIPWLFAEMFYYRRLIEATGYFGRHGPAWLGRDPFLPDKREELGGDAPWQILIALLRLTRGQPAASLRALIHHCVWGNRIDLGYNQVAADMGRAITLDKEQENLLADDTAAVVNHLLRPQPRHKTVQVICDNTGTELLMDLVLVDYLLRTGQVSFIKLHIKVHPTFVSDAFPPDIPLTLRAIRARGFVGLAARLQDYLRQHRLRLATHHFWTTPGFFWNLPPVLQTDLQTAHLVIIKGDANYRRLLGDSRWPTTTPMAAAVPYFPAPFVALRTLKSDPVVGLPPGQADHLDQADPDWRVNGRRGVIQAVL